MVQQQYMWNVAQHLVEEESYVFKPVSWQHRDFWWRLWDSRLLTSSITDNAGIKKTCLKMMTLTVRLLTSIKGTPSWHGWVAMLTITLHLAEILQVFTFKKKLGHLPATVIQKIGICGSLIKAILAFHSMFVMNLITWNSLCTLFIFDVRTACRVYNPKARCDCFSLFQELRENRIHIYLVAW